MKKSLPFFIASRNLLSNKVSTIVSISSIALSTTLLLIVWLLIQETEKTIQQNSGGFDAVLGARGSKLQLVLNSIFHMDSSPGNISMKDYQQIKNNRAVKTAYPLAVGDNYYGFRIVGTDSAYFRDHEYKTGKAFSIKGKIFSDDSMEAIVGQYVADKLEIKIGDTFQPYHGLQFNPNSKHKEIYTVTGIIEKTGTPVDRVLWIPLSGIQNMEGHSESQRDSVSAVLITLKGKAGFFLDSMYNRQGKRMTFAWPIALTIRDFFEKTAWATLALKIIGVMVAFIAFAANFAILFNSIRERRNELSIFRTIGMPRKLLLLTVILEGILISIIAVLASWFLFWISSTVIQNILWEKIGILISTSVFSPQTYLISGFILIIGALTAIIPGLIAYKSHPLKEL